ncbi:MAG TPA: leucyl aminopeptidase, partial [Actinomycetales bacterium]|nr:leucyl aminopeptidase [Actinomycetales bacterium]
KNPHELRADALVIGVIKTDDSAQIAGEPLPRAALKTLNGQLKALGVTGVTDEVLRVPAGDSATAPILLLVGLGTEEEARKPESLRRAAGAALLRADGFEKVGIALPLDLDASQAQAAGAVAEGALLGAYRFETYRAQDEKNPVVHPQKLELAVSATRDKEIRAAVERGRVLAAAVCGARDLINTAPNDLPPAIFAETAKTAVKGTGLKIEVLDEKALLSGGYGGIMGVGQGSSRPPRLVKLTWSPSKKAKHVALVGKGITFDSGGLSIKPSSGMETMKSDMSGAAAVLHTMIAAAALNLPVRVTAWLALAENMPSGTAQRPSDVITIYGGKTVEVLNTDAEGRLVMADVLVAAREENADVIVDIATLTGAQVVALGTRVAGVMGSDEARDQVVAAADKSGELAWPMPLPEELRASLKSKIADIANIGDRWGGMLSAGVFLQEFVEDTPWAHIDIAGPSFNEGSNWGYTPAGGTGYGVRTLLTFLEEVEN